MEFFEKELSTQLMGCFYEVRNKYGRFHRERLYDTALGELFTLRKIPFVAQPRIGQFSFDTGAKIGYIVCDKLVAEKIVIEIKAKPFTTRDDQGQCIEYLKTFPYEILYLVNFGEANFMPQRFIYTNDRKPFMR